ncbi:MAG: hypothetical protein IPP83_05100 [Flavobacteriales bacterium]|nr:hypothetical protein [Flavobacteriales bacterium]
MDENLGEYVPRGLHLLSQHHFPALEVISTIDDPSMGRGVKDPDLIPLVAQKHGVLLTKDINIARTRALFQMCKDYKLGTFFLKLPTGQDRHWEIVQLLVRNWQVIVKITNKEKRPFAYRLTPRGGLEPMSM